MADDMPPKKAALFWAPNPNARPVLDPNNPLRRVYPRKEPQAWKEPRKRLGYLDKENGTNVMGEHTAEKAKVRYGWGVRCVSASTTFLDVAAGAALMLMLVPIITLITASPAAL